MTTSTRPPSRGAPVDDWAVWSDRRTSAARPAEPSGPTPSEPPAPARPLPSVGGESGERAHGRRVRSTDAPGGTSLGDPIETPVPARTGRRPGGEDTRGRILAAARTEFGERGFDGTTIRGVAAAASVDPALVHHYFGSKQRLFVAAMEIPVDFDAAVVSVVAGPKEQIGERFVAYVLHVWEVPAMRALMLGLVRSASADEVAAAMLRHVLAEGPFIALARAIDHPDAQFRATLVGAQIVGLAMARYVVRVEPIASADIDTVARAVGPTVQRYLEGDLGIA